MTDINHGLILLFQQGDEAAFNAVYWHFYDRIYTFCRYIVDDEEAEDITSEVFVFVWKIRAKLDSYKNIRAALYLNARNKCLMHLRSTKTRRRIDLTLAELKNYEEYSAIESEVIVHIHESLELLPEYYKNILKLSYYDGYKNEEIAGMLGISEKTVRNAKSIALKTIKTMVFKVTSQLIVSLVHLLK